MSDNDAPINVLWVGPPKSQLESTTLESDAKSTIDLALKATNPINFWCLDDQTSHYQKLFEDNGVDVKVRSIDTYIDEVEKLSTKFGSAATCMQVVKQTLLLPPRDKVADRVSFKDAFSLFVLATSGGYTLDSNVSLKINEKDNPFTLPSYESERLPYQVGGEVWLMYAPPQSAPFNQALNNYLSEWNNIQVALDEDPNNPEKIYEFHSSVTNSIADAVAAIATDLMEEDEESNWKYSVSVHSEDSETCGTATIPALPIEKEYGNSHKPWHAARKIVEKEYTQMVDLNINLPAKLMEMLRNLKDMGNQDGENPSWLSHCHVLTYFSLRCIHQVSNHEEMLSKLTSSNQNTINTFQLVKTATLNDLTEVLQEITQKTSLENPPTKQQKDAVKHVFQESLEKIKKIVDEPLKEKRDTYKDQLSRTQDKLKNAANDGPIDDKGRAAN